IRGQFSVALLQLLLKLYNKPVTVNSARRGARWIASNEDVFDLLERYNSRNKVQSHLADVGNGEFNVGGDTPSAQRGECARAKENVASVLKLGEQAFALLHGSEPFLLLPGPLEWGQPASRPPHQMARVSGSIVLRS